nr:NAC transcription factor ONAC010-like [Ipomoea batatas]
MDIQPVACVSGDDVQNPTDNDVDHLLRSINDDDYFRLLPPGYVFNPTDDELIGEYLDKQVKNLPLPRNRINSVNLYSFNPEALCQMFKDYCGNKEWYFFTPRSRKYRNGKRPNRAAGNGYWKATGADREILAFGTNAKVGYRKALVFYMGKPPNGQKTPWIMHEYRVEDGPECDRSVDAMKTSTSDNNVIQIQMSSFPNQNHHQLISVGLQWRQQPPPPYEENLQHHQKQEDHNNVLIHHHHHNNPLPQNYFHPENTTFQALQPSINANLHHLPYQPHNWQEPHPSFNGDHHLYYHHNSSAPITADNNIPYQQHNSELLEAPQPGINGDTNNPHQQQNYSQAPQPSTNNGNDTTKTQTTDDDDEENDANYDTNQFLAD